MVKIQGTGAGPQSYSIATFSQTFPFFFFREFNYMSMAQFLYINLYFIIKSEGEHFMMICFH